MTDGTDKSFELRLRNADGIPILMIGGSITKTALRSIRGVMDQLASAGHYHIVLNLERAHAANWRCLDDLTDSVQNIRSHYGAVDLIATRDLTRQILSMNAIARLFRISPSERQAISYIKRLYRQPDGISQTNARLLETPR